MMPPMATPFPRPRLVLSKCLELEACRYNGVSIRAPLVRRMEPFVELLAVCPEVEVGLGIPRDPVRLVRNDRGRGPEGEPHLMIQPSTGRDLTGAMTSFSSAFLDQVEPVDGFLLKSRSPSCGIKDTKIYTDVGDSEGDPEKSQPMPVEKGSGLFAAAVLARFGDRAIEDEGRLTNFRIRHHFLTKLFTFARLRDVAAAGQAGQAGESGDKAGVAALVDFQARHKLLLMAYHQTAMRAMGRLVANPERRPFAEVVADYREELARALARPAKYTAHVNVLMHALGYFKTGLSAAEKRHFLDALDEYREGRLPLSAPLTTLQSWIARFGEPYLAQQIYFEPYPRDLLELSDSGGSPPR